MFTQSARSFVGKKVNIHLKNVEVIPCVKIEAVVENENRKKTVYYSIEVNGISKGNGSLSLKQINDIEPIALLEENDV